MCRLQILAWRMCALQTTTRPALMPQCLPPTAARGVRVMRCGTGWRCADTEPHASVLAACACPVHTPLRRHACKTAVHCRQQASAQAMVPCFRMLGKHAGAACVGPTLWGMPRPHLAKVRCGLHRLASASIVQSSSWPLCSICSSLGNRAFMAARVWRSSVRMSARPTCFCRNEPTVQGPAW